MAQIDLKKVTFRILDGRAATLTSDHTNANADILFTAKPHIGSRLPRVTFTDPSAINQTLAVTVSGYDIDISLATDGAGTITTTATLAIAAVIALAAAAALVTPSNAPANDGSGILEAKTIAALATGPRSLTLNIGDGNMTWTEKKAREYTRNAGNLGTVRDGDQDPVELRFDAIWEFLRASVGGTVTPSDVLKNRGEAAAWTSSDTVGACEPYSVDLEVEFNPACSPVEKEYYIFPKFRYDNIEHDLKGGALAFSGMCNVVEPTVSRDDV